MSQPVGLGIPLSSNNRANANTPIAGSGVVVAGVQSVNAQAGNLTLLGDASIDVTNIGSGQLQFSTAGNAQNFAAVSCTTLNASGSVTAGGAVSGQSVAATGSLSGNSLTLTTDATVGGNVVATGGVQAGTVGLFPTIQSQGSPLLNVGFFSSGPIAIPTVANGAVAVVTLLQAYINAVAPGVFFVTVWNQNTSVGGIKNVAQFQIVSPGQGTGGGTTYQLINIYNTGGYAITFTSAVPPAVEINIQNTTGSSLANLVYSFVRI